MALSCPWSVLDATANFGALGRIAGHSFNDNLMQAFIWAQSTYGLGHDDIRPGK